MDWKGTIKGICLCRGAIGDDQGLDFGRRFFFFCQKILGVLEKELKRCGCFRGWGTEEGRG